ncbi:EAL domain-containing protein, partial [Gammaproteobacteria bacterium]|nr:EAL domain-containing protein [Gammaproteobacteria bacterium]
MQVIVLYSNYLTTEAQENQQIELRLESAKNNFKNQFAEHGYYLAAFAETAARDFGLKQVFDEDTRSFLVALNNHRKRIHADLAIAVSNDGIVVGELINAPVEDGSYKVRVGAGQDQPFSEGFQFDLSGSSSLFEREGDIYQLSFSPLKSGDLIFGWIGFGYNIDKRLALKFAGQNNLTTAFAIKNRTAWQILASSQSESQSMPVIAEHELVDRVMSGNPVNDVIATAYTLGFVEDRQIVAIMYGARADLLVAIQGRWRDLSLLAAITLLLSLSGAYLIAAGIGRPVKALVEQARDIASGNYKRSIKYFNKDELGQLAHEFNQMKKAVVSRERTISRHAFYDLLTALPNRHQLNLTLEEMLNQGSPPFALIRLGLQRIKDVNYSFGHDVGDKVIQAVAERLASICELGLLFSVGGNGFVLIAKDEDRRWLDARIDAIQQDMAPEFVLQNISVHITVQFGIAWYPEHDRNGTKLLEMASTALHHAELKGLSQLEYDESMFHTTVERLELINGFNNAIGENQLVLFYQPKLDLKKGMITEVEALVRWQHPQYGMVPPDKFISLAEQTGYIHDLTRWVLDTALQQYRRWRDEDGIQLPIAINVSAESLRDSEFFNIVESALEQHGLSADAICIEVTESVVVDNPETTIRMLERFQQKGIRLAVDDYGTGYSSLAQLKQLPVNELKIDKAFVTLLHQQQADQVIVR